MSDCEKLINLFKSINVNEFHHKFLLIAIV